MLPNPLILSGKIVHKIKKKNVIHTYQPILILFQAIRDLFLWPCDN